MIRDQISTAFGHQPIGLFGGLHPPYIFIFGQAMSRILLDSWRGMAWTPMALGHPVFMRLSGRLLSYLSLRGVPRFALG